MNKLKNEYILKLGEKEILLRPTFSNLTHVESSVGSLTYIAYLITAGSKDPKKTLSFTDVAKIVYFCQANKKVDGSPELSLDDVWELIQEAGAFRVYGEVSIFISQVTAGNKNAPEVPESVKKN